jgi:F0F1-type ATP synthase membrane subunit b/b'
MAKSLRSLAIIAICAVILFFGYQYFYAKPLQKQIDTTKASIVTQLSAINNLETARMTLEKIVE